MCCPNILVRQRYSIYYENGLYTSNSIHCILRLIILENGYPVKDGLRIGIRNLQGFKVWVYVIYDVNNTSCVVYEDSREVEQRMMDQG